MRRALLISWIVLAAGSASAGSDANCLRTCDRTKTEVERFLGSGEVEETYGIMFNSCRNSSLAVTMRTRRIAVGPRIGTIASAAAADWGNGDVLYQVSYGHGGSAAMFCADGRVYLFDQLCSP